MTDEFRSNETTHPGIRKLIVEELGNPSPTAQMELAQIVARSLEYFRHYDSLFSRAGNDAIIDRAQRISRGIAALEGQLDEARGLLGDFLFTPPFARGARGALGAKQAFGVQTTYERQIRDILDQLRRDCDRIITAGATGKKTKRWHGPEHDRAERFCATLAYDLMARFSKKKITSSAEGPYHRIASYLFEMLTDRAEVNLNRHCTFVRKTRPKLIRIHPLG